MGRVIAAILISLFIVYQGIYLLAFSAKEGVGSFTLIAVVIVATPLLLLWGIFYWLKRKHASKWAYLAAALVIISIFELVLPVSPIKTTVVSANKQKLIEATKVSNVTDELYYSNNGNPIGIRIRYQVEFPATSTYSVSSNLHAIDKRYHHYQTSMSHFANIDRQPEPESVDAGTYKYKTGVTYHFTEDLLPGFIYLYPYKKNDHQAGDVCVIKNPTQTMLLEDLEKLLGEDIRTPYRINVSVNGYTYFVSRRTAIDENTRNQYSLKTFHDSAVKEGATKCEF